MQKIIIKTVKSETNIAYNFYNINKLLAERTIRKHLILSLCFLASIAVVTQRFIVFLHRYFLIDTRALFLFTVLIEGSVQSDELLEQ